MRLLLILLIAAVVAYFTVPTRAQHEADARATIQAYRPGGQAQQGFSLDDVAGYAKGMFAGQGSYQSYYVASHYAVDMPGPEYVECYGAFTIVKCQVKRS